MTAPSTAWREQPAPDEDQRFAAYAEQITAMQRRKSAKQGEGRALHRKQVLALRGSLAVLPDLPAYASHGLFARPGVYEARLRLSHAAADHAPDRAPDARGLAIRVLGVEGPGALGTPTTSQDFLLINHERFAFARSDEFVGLVLAAGQGKGALLRHLLRRYGLLGGLRMVLRFARTMGMKFTGFATEPFYSAAPIACGPYAARVRLLPASDRPTPGADRDWARDIKDRLAHGPLHFDLQLQFFVDERRTPIEDASVSWTEDIAPYVTVARLTVPTQAFTGEAAQRFAAEVEAGTFDPWNALLEHRPLGDIMRTRKVVYYASVKARGAA